MYHFSSNSQINVIDKVYNESADILALDGNIASINTNS